jgi:hypothetical protein
LDPFSQPALSGMSVDPAGAAQVRQASDQASFQSIYREALSESPAARPVSPADDMRTFGQNFRDLERGLQIDRSGMLRMMMPPPSSASPAHGEYRSRSSNERGTYDDAGSRMLMRDSDRIGGGAPRTIFSDRASDAAPPVVQTALGIAPETKTERINFSGEISSLSARIENTMNTIKERIVDKSPKTIEQAMEHSSEIQGLVREGDNLNSERSMMMSLHLSSHQEARTRMLTAFEHVTGITKKINEIFNQLKQGS